MIYSKNSLSLSRLLLVLLSLLALTACSSVSYYTQSVVGHSRLMLARKSLDKVIPKAEPELAAQLELAKELRQYAITELDLPDNKSYHSYVALKRDFPVWVVVATEPLSVQAKQWCYLVIGCASYRGYFSQAAAKRYAKRLERQGLETYVGGAPAYSTLGWFADPILPSMLRYGTIDFAETMFHELAHQVLYVKNDSDFNEAFATVVGERGAIKWLQQNRPDDVQPYRDKLAALDDFSALLKQTKRELQDVFASEQNDQDKLVAKQAVFDRLSVNYQTLKRDKWDARGWFDHWFNTPMNNARLAAFSTYRDRVPEINALLDSLNEDFALFYKQVSTQHNTKLANK